MKITGEEYFGVIPECLDIFTLSYRWFGCTWTVHGSTWVMTDYWFADTRHEIEMNARRERQVPEMHLVNPESVREMYEAVRRQQAQQDWEKRTRLSCRLVLKEPWRSVKAGWYVLRSRNEYPNYVSAIRKGRWLVWIEHVAVCEHEEDLNTFMHKVNSLHNIELTLLRDLQEGHGHGSVPI